MSGWETFGVMSVGNLPSVEISACFDRSLCHVATIRANEPLSISREDDDSDCFYIFMFFAPQAYRRVLEFADVLANNPQVRNTKDTKRVAILQT